jgi:hypothetical protein
MSSAQPAVAHSSAPPLSIDPPVPIGAGRPFLCALLLTLGAFALGAWVWLGTLGTAAIDPAAVAELRTLLLAVAIGAIPAAGAVAVSVRRIAGLCAYGLGLMLFGAATALVPVVTPELWRPAWYALPVTVSVVLALGLATRIGRIFGSRLVNAAVLGSILLAVLGGGVGLIAELNRFVPGADIPIALLLVTAAAGAIPTILLGPWLILLGVIARRRRHGEIPADGRLPRRPIRETLVRLWAPALVFGLAVVAWGWVWFGPIATDDADAVIEDFLAGQRNDAPDQLNAYWDYIELPRPTLATPRPGLTEGRIDLRVDPAGADDGPISRDYDPAPAVGELAANLALIEQWDAARRKPAARGDFDPLTAPKPYPYADGILGLAKVRLNGTIHDPAAFIDAVAACRHAAVTLFTDGSLADSAIGCVMAGMVVRSYLPVFLALHRGSLQPADYARLDAEAAAMATASIRSRGRAFSTEALYSSARGMAGLRAANCPEFIISGVTSRVRAVAAIRIDEYLTVATQPNHLWTPPAQPQVGPGLALRLDPVLFAEAVPVYSDMMRDLRRVETWMRLGRLMLAIESTNDRSIGGHPPNLRRDDWTADGDYSLRLIDAAPAAEPGYELRSAGLDTHRRALVVPPVLR